MPAKPKKRAPPPGEGNLVPVQFRFPEELLGALDARVEKLNARRVLKLTRTDVVRLLVDRWTRDEIDLGEGAA
jgi:hypothetical protein